MRPPWTIRRILALTLSLGLLGFGVKCCWDAHHLSQNFERWKTAKPMDGVIDLSAPGRFVFPFHQTCSSAHGEAVTLRVPPEALQGTTVTQLLAGLDATLEIADKSGSNVVASAASEDGERWGTFDGAIPVFRIATFHKGVYQATVTVEQGAPALKGVSQRLEGRYLLCGLELLPATIGTAIGVVSLTIGGIIGIIVLMLILRGRGSALAPGDPAKTSDSTPPVHTSPG